MNTLVTLVHDHRTGREAVLVVALTAKNCRELLDFAKIASVSMAALEPYVVFATLGFDASVIIGKMVPSGSATLRKFLTPEHELSLKLGRAIALTAPGLFAELPQPLKGVDVRGNSGALSLSVRYRDGDDPYRTMSPLPISALARWAH